MTIRTVPVSGLSCRHCILTVTEQLSELDGVSDIEIDLVAGGVSTVRYTAPVEPSDEQIQAVLTAGGAFAVAR